MKRNPDLTLLSVCRIWRIIAPAISEFIFLSFFDGFLFPVFRVYVWLQLSLTQRRAFWGEDGSRGERIRYSNVTCWPSHDKEFQRAIQMLIEETLTSQVELTVLSLFLLLYF